MNQPNLAKEKLTQFSVVLRSFCFLFEFPYVSMAGSSQWLVQPATLLKKTHNTTKLLGALRATAGISYYLWHRVAPVNGGARRRSA